MNERAYLLEKTMLKPVCYLQLGHWSRWEESQAQAIAIMETVRKWQDGDYVMDLKAHLMLWRDPVTFTYPCHDECRLSMYDGKRCPHDNPVNGSCVECATNFYTGD